MLQLGNILELVKQRWRQVAFVAVKFAEPSWSELRQRLTVSDSAFGELKTQQFAIRVRDPMQLEAIEPAHRSFAALRRTRQYPMLPNAVVVTHGQRRRVEQGDPITHTLSATLEAFQRGTHPRCQPDKPTITD